MHQEPRASLGTRSIDQIHERAIELWIHMKHEKPDLNPASGIYVVLTNSPWPTLEPLPTNAIALCSALSVALGEPPLTTDKVNSLAAKSVILLRQYERGRSPMHYMNIVNWLTRIGYAIGILAMILGGFSLVLAGLIVAVYWCFGAARMASRMANCEPRPHWEFPVILAMYIGALATLYVIGIIRLLGAA